MKPIEEPDTWEVVKATRLEKSRGENIKAMEGKGDQEPIRALPVKNGDVVPFAKASCRGCFGSGEVVLVVGAERRARACSCGVRRFMRKQRSVIMNDGRLVALPPFTHMSVESLKALNVPKAEPIYSDSIKGDGPGGEIQGGAVGAGEDGPLE